MKTAAIVTAHNVERWVGTAMRSVAQQTQPADEIIVVENGSTDDSLSAIETTSRSLQLEDRITIITDKALGPSGARNRGAEAAIGKGADLLAFLDGDDWWRPRHLGCLSALLSSHPDAAGAFGWLLVRSPHGKLTSMRVHRKRRFTYDDLCLHKSPMTTASALVIRSTDFETIQGFDPAIPVGEDWELMLRLTSHGQVISCDHRFLINYRRRPGSASSDTRNAFIGQLTIEKHHPNARLAKHWWWLLNQARESGDPRLFEEVKAAQPERRVGDYFSHQFLRYLAGLGTGERTPHLKQDESKDKRTKKPGSE